jgi:putative Mg2+ transporter-C (MgtC) family protein
MERGRPAGLRTTILVSFAACISMIQTNLLLGVVGKHPDSFVVMDLMRFPLGILTGMGFIGGGAILRKGNMVSGVTTAATLWFVTVIGLCFGGGQLGLGISGTVLAIFILWTFYWVEEFMPRDRRGTLQLTTTVDHVREDDIRSSLATQQYKVTAVAKTYAENEQLRQMRFEIRWRDRADDQQFPPFLEKLAHHAGVLKLEWTS